MTEDVKFEIDIRGTLEATDIDDVLEKLGRHLIVVSEDIKAEDETMASWDGFISIGPSTETSGE